MLLLIVTVMNYIAYLIHILIKVVAGSFKGFMMQFILFPFQSIHPEHFKKKLELTFEISPYI